MICGGGGCGGSLLGAVAGGALAFATGGASLAAVAAGASIGSTVGGTLGSVLFPASAPAMPNLPSPAAPAPTVRASNGATVSLGSDTASQRVSGARPGAAAGAASSSGDALSGLGRSGLAL